MKIGVLKCQTHHIQTVQAHSAKADQNPYVLRTPGLLEMCLNAALNQIAIKNRILCSFSWASSQNVPEQVAKRNLVPHLWALQSARASSAAFALSAELRLARR